MISRRQSAACIIHRLCLSALFLTASALLTSCGGNDSPPLQVAKSDIVAGASVTGPTPFISFVSLTGNSLKNIASYRFTIAPKAGTLSRPVSAIYTAAALKRRGYYVEASNAANLPVFGLYPGYTNQVAVELKFIDGSRQGMTVSIAAPLYVDPNGIYDAPTFIKKRSAAGDLDFFYIKSTIGPPIVIDSDGEIRWVGPAAHVSPLAIFDANGFVLGAVKSVTLTRVELDGSASITTLAPSGYTNFHHNIDLGKLGLLGELDGMSMGVASVESTLVEFAPDGTILKEWDFADILGRHMRSLGDDPAPFIRPGADWFHINASTYDPRDDTIIASSRENFVIKVDYKTGVIRWIFGDPTKYWFTFPSLRAKALVLEAGGHFPIGQHATSINSRGELMLFNNGAPSFNQGPGVPAGAARTYSEVSSYMIDPVAMTAREVWHFDYGKSIFSDICSSAYETQTGAMLVSYAAASNRTRARLVGVDAQRNIIFDFEYKSTPCGTSWNAQPFPFESLVFNS